VNEAIDPHIDGFLPIGWLDEFRSDEFPFTSLRAEIVAEAPIGAEWMELAVVDPDNLAEKGFPFIAVPGSETNGKRLLVAVPAFTVLSGSPEITYGIRLGESEWNHGVEPLKGVRGGPIAVTDPQNPLITRYTMAMIMGTSSYIPSPVLTSVTPEFYVALEEVRPAISEAGLRPAADLVAHLDDDDLIRLAVGTLIRELRVSHWMF
jgi:hypothetical protein